MADRKGEPTMTAEQQPWNRHGRIAPLVALWLLIPISVLGQVANLTCTVTTGPEVELAWVNPGGFDTIEIELNRVVISTLAGDSTGTTVPVTTGVHDLCVVPITSGSPQPDSCCAIAVPDLTQTTTSAVSIGQAADPLNPNPATSSVTITDSLLIGDLQVRVEIDHTFRGDLEVRLTSPTGTTLTLANNDGGSADDIRTTFFDGGSPYDGDLLSDQVWMMPEGPGSFADFAGTSSEGNWTLTVDDTFADLDDGLLEEWQLSIFEGTIGFPIANLSCLISATEPGQALLEWTNSSPYDSIDLEIDGSPIATLPGDAVTFATDPLDGLTTICLRPSIVSGPLPPTCCTLEVGVPPVTNLTCVASSGTGSVAVSWTNSAVYYDAIEVSVDGALVETLAPTAESTSWPIAPLATHSICIRPTSQGELAPPVCCNATAPVDTSDASVIIAGELIDGLIDSVTALESALLASGESVVLLEQFDADTIGSPRAIWVMLGTFPQNHSLTEAEGQLLANLITSGVPTYLEGGDVWGFDDPTAVMEVDGVAPDAIDGDDTFQGMIGLNHSSARLAGLTAAYENDAGSASDYLDQLNPAFTDSLGPNAGAIWIDDGTGGSTLGYTTGIHYDTSPPAGNVICQSWEFGGFGGDTIELAQRYLLALGLVPPTEFRRGDANDDASVDVADAVSLLDALFAGGTFPSCADAADPNDDGTIDVSDAIFTLSFLFSGGAAPPSPGASSCGQDPTDDGLGCTSGCP